MMKNTFDLLRFVVLLFVAISMAGCGGFVFRTGSRPDIAALDSLTIGQSSSDEVRSTLGAPFGTGRTYLPYQESPQEMWSYYYEESSMEDGRRTFLLVYLKDGVYDGYMWFSSLPDADQPANAWWADQYDDSR
ncbi:MAG: hypothetical protein QNI99_08340 [Woeseiaceae bacterium]|nr:hypothetical protein [Woeseiaceae bacterium]